MTTEESIKAAEDAVLSARDALYEANLRLDALYQKRDFEKYGIRAGVRVRDRNGTELIVTKVESKSWGGLPYLHANPFKNDGTISKQNRLLIHGYEVIAPAEGSTP